MRAFHVSTLPPSGALPRPHGGPADARPRRVRARRLGVGGAMDRDRWIDRSRRASRRHRRTHHDDDRRIEGGDLGGQLGGPRAARDDLLPGVRAGGVPPRGGRSGAESRWRDRDLARPQAARGAGAPTHRASPTRKRRELPVGPCGAGERVLVRARPGAANGGRVAGSNLRGSRSRGRDCAGGVHLTGLAGRPLPRRRRGGRTPWRGMGALRVGVRARAAIAIRADLADHLDVLLRITYPAGPTALRACSRLSKICMRTTLPSASVHTQAWLATTRVPLESDSGSGVTSRTGRRTAPAWAYSCARLLE